MEVILSKNVERVGKVGDVIKVKEGYARNYLLPQKLAFPATPGNIKRMEQEKAKLEAEYEKTLKEAEALAEKLAKVSCNVEVEVNDLEKLYGAVTSAEIVKSLEQEGFNFERKDIVLEKPIEELGIFEAGVKLHPQVVAKIRVWVTKK